MTNNEGSKEHNCVNHCQCLQSINIYAADPMWGNPQLERYAGGWEAGSWEEGRALALGVHGSFWLDAKG